MNSCQWCNKKINVGRNLRRPLSFGIIMDQFLCDQCQSWSKPEKKFGHFGNVIPYMESEIDELTRPHPMMCTAD